MLYCISFSAHYAFVINDAIPTNSEYKWLDMRGAGLGRGDVDSATGFAYEPRPFIDRVCDFDAPVSGQQVAVVIDSWGRYDRHVYCKYDRRIYAYLALGNLVCKKSRG